MNYTIILVGVFIVVSLINSFLDLRTLHISIILNYAGILICFLIQVFYKPDSLINCIAGGVLLFLIFILVRQIAHKGLGWGDIHYSLFCGFITGVPGFILSAIISSFIGIIIFVFMRFILQKENALKIKIPFIPIMFLGSLIAIPLAEVAVKLL